jgi:metal-sulfur cluster biosynthetic enzyme
MPILVDDIRTRLDDVKDPCSVGAGMPMGLDEMGLVKRIEVRETRVSIEIRLTSPSCFMHSYFIDEIQWRVGELPGVDQVDVEFDLGVDWAPSMMRQDVRERRDEIIRGRVRQLHEARQRR